MGRGDRVAFTCMVTYSIGPTGHDSAKKNEAFAQDGASLPNRASRNESVWGYLFLFYRVSFKGFVYDAGGASDARRSRKVAHPARRTRSLFAKSAPGSGRWISE